ncbi:MAG: hypothetical protein RL591_1990, partial [Planctomycetota bacterium]
MKRPDLDVPRLHDAALARMFAIAFVEGDGNSVGRAEDDAFPKRKQSVTTAGSANATWRRRGMALVLLLGAIAFLLQSAPFSPSARALAGSLSSAR